MVRIYLEGLGTGIVGMSSMIGLEFMSHGHALAALPFGNHSASYQGLGFEDAGPFKG